MSKKKVLKPLTNYLGERVSLCSEFKRPRTRRELLAAGIIPFAASLVVPSAWNLLSAMAQAEEGGCENIEEQGVNSELAPIITISLVGGPAMASNWVPKDAGLQLLSDYSSVGLGSGAEIANRLTPEFANRVDFYDGSQMLAGLREQSVTNTRNQTSFFATAVGTIDDSRENKIGLEGMVEAFGRAGKKLGVLGSRSSLTGHQHSFAKLRPSVPSTQITSVESLNQLAGGPTGALGKLSKADRVNLMKMVERLSEAQKIKLASISGGQELSKLVSCATQKNVTLLSSDEDVDPRQDQEIRSTYNNLWGIADSNPGDSRELIQASLVYNVLKGYATTCSLEVGGCDYHGRDSRELTDQKDLEIGRLIGRTLQSAAILNKKLFIYVISDGSVSMRNGSFSDIFTSDNGEKSAFYTLLFDPDAKNIEQLAQTKPQMGHYNSSCAVDRETLIGDTPELAAMAIAYNYLLFSYNEISRSNREFDNVFKAALSNNQKEELLMYKPSS